MINVSQGSVHLGGEGQYFSGLLLRLVCSSFMVMFFVSVTGLGMVMKEVIASYSEHIISDKLNISNSNTQ